jgi:hypothetical protein
MTEPNCPSCGTPLERANSGTGTRFQCRTCQGVIIALAVLRHVLTEGVGSQVWVASATRPTDGRPCGFCARSMRPTSVPQCGDHPAKVEVCRVCDTIWVPADQAALLPMLAGSAGAPLAPPLPTPPPTRCPECGAPFAMAADGCCPYCHRRIEVPLAPEVLVFFSHTDPHDDAKPALRTLGGAALFALGALLGN